MKLNLVEMDNKVMLLDSIDFEPKHIFECGQCFRWDEEKDGSYTGVAHDRILNIKKNENNIIFNNTNIKEFNEVWLNYFDLKTDYSKIKKQLNKDDLVMQKATEFGGGIRILKQDLWETVISFIISANNNIPRIKKIINLLCEKYGKFIGTYNGKKYYSFPKPDALSCLTKEDLLLCNTGYRASYILNTAIHVVDKGLVLEDYLNLPNNVYKKKLMELSGVGPKVADCIAFFGLGKLEAFPIDVWVKRIMEYFYFKEETSSVEIQHFAKQNFGVYAGYAQQFLFYYGRELGIGKEDKRNAGNNS